MPRTKTAAQYEAQIESLKEKLQEARQQRKPQLSAKAASERCDIVANTLLSETMRNMVHQKKDHLTGTIKAYALNCPRQVARLLMERVVKKGLELHFTKSQNQLNVDLTPTAFQTLLQTDAVSKPGVKGAKLVPQWPLKLTWSGITDSMKISGKYECRKPLFPRNQDLDEDSFEPEDDDDQEYQYDEEEGDDDDDDNDDEEEEDDDSEEEIDTHVCHTARHNYSHTSLSHRLPVGDGESEWQWST
eukprot:TRINITY_DN60690_c0_g1_i1.p1 TRINITY_DN60690_c0_g1~~TRINITY_DN60690_c0_g1_i1.p1  ORF type:complete len:267 (+),score=33.42 TRINITY_DN60690_c0_g1_i1:68-802(+)